jgi:hypothetical protein
MQILVLPFYRSFYSILLAAVRERTRSTLPQ